MKKRYIAAGAAVIAAVGAASISFGSGAVAQTKKAQTTPWNAMKTAAAKVPGSKAHSATYVNEGGKWIYDVIVTKGKTITEVEVDAATGKAGDTEVVTPAEEGEEMADELNALIGNKTAPATEKAEAGEENEASEKP